MPYFAVIGLQVVCIVHLMRRRGNMIWLSALIFLPVVSALAYFIVEILPGLGGNRHLRSARSNVVALLDPVSCRKPGWCAAGVGDGTKRRY